MQVKHGQVPAISYGSNKKKCLHRMTYGKAKGRNLEGVICAQYWIFENATLDIFKAIKYGLI